MRHVVECPRLSNGWYRCSYHKLPERFLECNNLCATVPKSRFRDHKLDVIEKFFRWIGRRRFEKESHMYPNSPKSLLHHIGVRESIKWINEAATTDAPLITNDLNEREMNRRLRGYREIDSDIIQRDEHIT